MAPDRRAPATHGCPPARPAVPAPRRPRDPAVLDGLLARARQDQLARPRAARVLADVIDQLLDERCVAVRGSLVR